MLTLNTATSIVDFAKSRGLPSDFESRKKLYITTGLTPESGEYRGTAKENTDFLNYLASQEKQSGVSISPQNVYDVIKAKTTTPTITPTASTAPTETTPTAPTTPTTPTLTQEQVQGIFGSPVDENELARRALEMVQGGATFPLQQETAEAEKATATLAGQKEKEDFIRKLASSGLIFGGRKEAGISEIDTNTLAKQLGIDRKFSLLIASGLESAAQSIAKEAQQGNQNALQSLRSLGYDINPLTGAIEPTLAARKGEESEKRAEETQKRFEASQAATEARFQQSQAATEARFEATQARILQNQSGALTPEEIPQVAAYMQYVTAGKDTTGKDFALTNVPEKLRGNVAVGLLNAKAEANQPRNWTDEEIRTMVKTNIKLGLEGIIQQIQSSATLVNKDRAILIANELLPKKKSIFERPTTPKTQTLPQQKSTTPTTPFTYTPPTITSILETLKGK